MANGGSSSGGSGKPAYCSQVDALKQSVKALGNINVVQNGTTRRRPRSKKSRTTPTQRSPRSIGVLQRDERALKQINKLSHSVSQLSSSPATAVAAIPGEASAWLPRQRT